MDGGFRDWLEGLSRRELVAYGLLACLLVGGVGLWAVRREPPPQVRAAPSAPEAAPSPAPIFVHVAGLVRRPGVYELRQGDRVVDAIELAGGALPKAALEALNLAAELTDGQQVLVPKKGAAAGASGGAAGEAQQAINLNTADAAALETLPGIGPVLSQRIVDYREAHGPFARVEDLMEVSGIGEKRLEAIRDLVVV